MQKLILYFVFALFFHNGKAATVFSQDGIKLNYEVQKEKVIFVPALKKKVVIWKAKLELVNSNKKPVAVTAPCCLYYAFSYLFPNEISAVQDHVTGYSISDAYKTYATQKPTVLKPKQKVLNEKYFATYEDVNLNDATFNLEVKYAL